MTTTAIRAFHAEDHRALKPLAPALLFVKTSWCPYCRDAVPLMEKVAAALGSTVGVYSIDGDKSKRLVQQLGVTSYPTLLAVSPTGIKKYEGDRTFDRIIGFVCTYAARGNYCLLTQPPTPMPTRTPYPPLPPYPTSPYPTTRPM